MFRWVGIMILVATWSTEISGDCDPSLPHCQGHKPRPGRQDCPPFWLIPGKANDCTKPTAKKIMTIDANSVSISPSPIKLPGCFTITMKVDVQQMDLPKSFFTKIEYNWWNLPQFSSLPCQNASANGCGGYGNNCFYCDVCKSLQEVDTVKSNIVNQFKSVDCPTKAGTYDLKREFCFNDFSEMDKDNDCKLDFLQNGQAGENYQDAVKNLKQLGYGTVVAKFTLAHNATSSQKGKKTSKEGEIEKTIEKELETKRRENNWAVGDQEYETFRNWYVQYRKDTWHKQEYLPWLLYYNEMGCMTVSFDVCDKQPTASTSSGSGYQCV